MSDIEEYIFVHVQAYKRQRLLSCHAPLRVSCHAPLRVSCHAPLRVSRLATEGSRSKKRPTCK